jgi:uncharacterized protein involved in exopolysaccharide biosynthesis
VIAISAALAFGLPPVYRASATILIESQEVPEEFVTSTVTSGLSERVQGITVRLLTHGKLWEVIEEMGLYPELRGSGATADDLVRRMRNDILIEVVEYQASASTNKATAISTYALKISYESDLPQTAQLVANRLATLYLDENRRIRGEKADAVTQFLAEEARKLKEEIGGLERELANFKQQNVDQLPELSQLNLRLYEQTEEKLERADESIRAMQDRKMALESQLAITNPYRDVYTDEGQRLQTPNERLSVLLSQFMTASSKYSPDHPDIIRLRREIEVLERQSGKAEAGPLVNRITEQRAALAEARRRYSNEHPDVRRLERTVAQLERDLRNLAFPKARTADDTGLVADNPTYVTLQTQLATVEANLRAEQERRIQLQKKLNEYEERLFRTPAVERDYLLLTRDYDNAKSKYEEIKNKLLEARLGLELESESLGEELTLVEEARLPFQPVEPNRPAILVLGGVLGLFMGLGGASIAEYRDKSIRGAGGLVQAFGAPPLATIPYIANSHDLASRRKKILVLAVGAMTFAGLVVLATQV